VATKRSLLMNLATARQKKADKAAATKRIHEAPKTIESKPIETEVITNPKRQLAKTCTDQAMIMGWDKAIQKTAYENSIAESEMRQILDDALDYEDKADPSGRIEGIEDWAKEKRGSSVLAAPKRRA
jgi:hypothetical protein